MTFHFTITSLGLCIAWTLFAGLANVGVALHRASGRESWVLYFLFAVALLCVGVTATIR